MQEMVAATAGGSWPWFWLRGQLGQLLDCRDNLLCMLNGATSEDDCAAVEGCSWQPAEDDLPGTMTAALTLASDASGDFAGWTIALASGETGLITAFDDSSKVVEVDWSSESAAATDAGTAYTLSLAAACILRQSSAACGAPAHAAAERCPVGCQWRPAQGDVPGTMTAALTLGNDDPEASEDFVGWTIALSTGETGTVTAYDDSSKLVEVSWHSGSVVATDAGTQYTLDLDAACLDDHSASTSTSHAACDDDAHATAEDCPSPACTWRPAQDDVPGTMTAALTLASDASGDFVGWDITVNEETGTVTAYDDSSKLVEVSWHSGSVVATDVGTEYTLSLDAACESSAAAGGG
jgi:hypothetical protein